LLTKYLRFGFGVKEARLSLCLANKVSGLELLPFQFAFIITAAIANGLGDGKL
jgi:hypothetical protein